MKETKPTQEEKGNILLSEFIGLKFQAYRDNSSYDRKFDTYSECLEWIEERGFEGYIPELGWGCGVGDHHENWNSLMQVVEKIEREFCVSISIEQASCCVDWQGTEPDDENLLEMLQSFDQIYEESNSKISATFNACVLFVGWLKLRQKGGEGE